MELKLYNFRCYGEDKITFSEGKKILIAGSSGNGKTTLLEAIYYALYGDVKNPCSHGSKSCKVEMIYKNMSIIRTHGPKTLTVQYKDTEYRDDEAQGIIDGLMGDKDIFLSSVYLRQSQRHPFFTGTKDEKMSLVRNLSLGHENIEEKKSKCKIQHKNIKLQLIAAESEYMAANSTWEAMSRKYGVKGDIVTETESDLRSQMLILTQDINTLESLERDLKNLKELKVGEEPLELEAQLTKELKGFSEYVALEKKLGGRSGIKASLQKVRDEIMEHGMNEKMINNINKELKGLQVMPLISNDTIEKRINEIKEILSTKYNKQDIIRKKAREELKVLNEQLKDNTFSISDLKRRKLIFDKWAGQEVKDKDKIKEMIDNLHVEIESKDCVPMICPHCNKQLKLQVTPKYELKKGIVIIRNTDNKRTINEILSDIKRLEELLELEIIDSDPSDVISLLEKRETLNSLIGTDSEERESELTEDEADKLNEELHNLEVAFTENNNHNLKATINNAKMEELKARINELKLNEHIDMLREELQILEGLLPIEEEMNKHIKESGKSNLTIEQGKEKRRLLEECRKKINEAKVAKDHNLNVEKKRKEILGAMGDRKISEMTQSLEDVKKKINNKEMLQYKLTRDGTLEKLEVIKARASSIEYLIKKMTEAEAIRIGDVLEYINSEINLMLEEIFDNTMKICLSSVKQLKSKNITKNEFNITIDYKGEDYDISSLSQGELDRLNIAFLVALNKMRGSSLIMLDESLNSLDSENFIKIMEILSKENKMILFVSHHANEGYFDAIRRIN